MKHRIITDAQGWFLPQFKGWFSWKYYTIFGNPVKFEMLQDALDYITSKTFEPEVVWEGE